MEEWWDDSPMFPNKKAEMIAMAQQVPELVENLGGTEGLVAWLVSQE